jgi:hypothetical protein
MTESELLNAVLDLARVFGWRTAHFRAALTRHGWRTPVQGDGAGFPDLVLVRGSRVIAIELKSDTGNLTDEQRIWLDALSDAGVLAVVWRPEHWRDGTIEHHLRRRQAPVAMSRRP